jgi:hypothetical protein
MTTLTHTPLYAAAYAKRRAASVSGWNAPLAFGIRAA